MKRISITRDSNGNVKFEEVSIDSTENVFFINLDPQDEHWPEIAANKLGRFPSAQSSQCQPNPDSDFKPKIDYVCKIHGHENERGIINIFNPLEKADTTLAQATQGQEITAQQVVNGGKSPYKISKQRYEVTASTSPPVVIQSGPGIGPGLELSATTDNTGIKVKGTPILSGIYNFTFTVDDAIGGNLQQVQYKMEVKPAPTT